MDLAVLMLQRYLLRMYVRDRELCGDVPTKCILQLQFH